MRKHGKIKISVVGCTLIDYIFNHVDFNSPDFKRYMSKAPGDGGLMPGKLVFLEDLEEFSGESFEKILPTILGKAQAAPDMVSIGGPAIVSMIHAAQLLQSQADISFYAVKGDDPTGEILTSQSKKTASLETHFITKPGRTPVTYVLSDPNYRYGEGERTFINSVGAADSLFPEDLPGEFFNADIIALGGTALVPGIHDNLDTLLERIPEACLRLVNTVYDFRNEKEAPGNPWPLGKSAESLSNIDLLIMDREEALRISGSKSLETAVSYFQNSLVGSFIITDGSAPITVGEHKAPSNAKNIYQLPVCDQIVEDLIRHGAGDTTGAGDNFAGGVIFSLASQFSKGNEKPDLMEAASWGIVSGGFACSHLGGIFHGTYEYEKLKILEKYYSSYKKQLASR